MRLASGIRGAALWGAVLLAAPGAFGQSTSPTTSISTSAAVPPVSTLPAGAGPGQLTGGSISSGAPAPANTISTATSNVGTPGTPATPLSTPPAGATAPGIPAANAESGFGAGAAAPIPVTTATDMAQTATPTPAAVPAAGSATAPVASGASVRPVAIGESLSVAGTSVSPPNLITNPVVVTPAVGSFAGGGSAGGAPVGTPLLDPLDTLR